MEYSEQYLINKARSDYFNSYFQNKYQIEEPEYNESFKEFLGRNKTYSKPFKLTKFCTQTQYLKEFNKEYEIRKSSTCNKYIITEEKRGRPKKIKGIIYDACLGDITYLNLKLEFNRRFFNNIISIVKDYITFYKPEGLPEIDIAHILSNALTYKDYFNLRIADELSYYENRLKRHNDELGIKHFIFTNVDCINAINWALRIYFEKGLKSMRYDGHSFLSSMLGNLRQIHRCYVINGNGKFTNKDLDKIKFIGKFVFINLPQEYKDMYMELFQTYPVLYTFCGLETNIFNNFKKLSYKEIKKLSDTIAWRKYKGKEVCYPNGWNEELVKTVVNLYSKEEYEVFSGLSKVNKIIDESVDESGNLSKQGSKELNKIIQKLQKPLENTDKCGGNLNKWLEWGKLSGELQIHESRMIYNDLTKDFSGCSDFLNKKRLEQIKDILSNTLRNKALDKEHFDSVIELSCNENFLMNAIGKELGFPDAKTRILHYYNEMKNEEINDEIILNSKSLVNEFELTQILGDFETGNLSCKSETKIPFKNQTLKSNLKKFKVELPFSCDSDITEEQNLKSQNMNLKFQNTNLKSFKTIKSDIKSLRTQRINFLKLLFYIYSYYYYFIYNGWKFSSYTSMMRTKCVKESVEFYNERGFLENMLNYCKNGFILSPDFKEFYPNSAPYEFNY